MKISTLVEESSLEMIDSRCKLIYQDVISIADFDFNVFFQLT